MNHCQQCGYSRLVTMPANFELEWCPACGCLRVDGSLVRCDRERDSDSAKSAPFWGELAGRDPTKH